MECTWLAVMLLTCARSAVQARMLPEAVRQLNLLLSMGKRVYVHCTAGINRANLTVVGYLTFVQVRIHSIQICQALHARCGTAELHERQTLGD